MAPGIGSGHPCWGAAGSGSGQHGPSGGPGPAQPSSQSAAWPPQVRWAAVVHGVRSGQRGGGGGRPGAQAASAAACEARELCAGRSRRPGEQGRDMRTKWRRPGARPSAHSGRMMPRNSWKRVQRRAGPPARAAAGGGRAAAAGASLGTFSHLVQQAVGAAKRKSSWHGGRHDNSLARCCCSAAGRRIASLMPAAPACRAGSLCLTAAAAHAPPAG